MGVYLLVCLLSTYLSHAQTITSFSPTSGPVGTSVTITGSGFDSSPANNIVFFGATMAAVWSAGPSSLTVTVPSGTNYQYLTVTNLSTNLTAYSSQPFIVTTLCSSTLSFASPVGIQGGSHNVEICDIDGDGLPDLVVPDYFNNYFTVTRNSSTSGSISFASKVTFPWASGGQPNEVSIGDFDGDGKPDVALGGNGGGTFVSVYRNTSTVGSISFAARQDFTASSGQGNGNKIIDIDGDGKPDLLSVHWSGNCLWVLRNTSAGAGSISFAAGISFATTSQPHKIEVSDLDGDGKADVIITAFTSNTMSIFRNTSTPGTISFATRQDFSPGTVPYFVHAGDLDADGKADIAVVNRDVATLAVYRNISTPGSISLAPKQTFATPPGTMTHYGVAFGDLDGDGKPDIAVGNYTLNVTSIFTNTSTSGNISFASRVDLTSGISYDVGLDDFDGDGRPDIVVTNSGTTLSILRNLCLLLPIELISFESECTADHVISRWSTASEINNDYFTLQRSRDGIQFENIGEVNGAGNSTGMLHYSFIDVFPLQGTNFYRLKQTDFDGRFSYSQVEVVNYESDEAILNLYPNPFNDYLVLQGTRDHGLVLIFDISGKEILRLKTTASQSILLTHDLPYGVYWLYYSTENTSRHYRIVK